MPTILDAIKDRIQFDRILETIRDAAGVSNGSDIPDEITGGIQVSEEDAQELQGSFDDMGQSAGVNAEGTELFYKDTIEQDQADLETLRNMTAEERATAYEQQLSGPINETGVPTMRSLEGDSEQTDEITGGIEVSEEDAQELQDSFDQMGEPVGVNSGGEILYQKGFETDSQNSVVQQWDPAENGYAQAMTTIDPSCDANAICTQFTAAGSGEFNNVNPNPTTPVPEELVIGKNLDQNTPAIATAKI